MNHTKETATPARDIQQKTHKELLIDIVKDLETQHDNSKELLKTHWATLKQVIKDYKLGIVKDFTDITFSIYNLEKEAEHKGFLTYKYNYFYDRLKEEQSKEASIEKTKQQIKETIKN